MAGEGIVGAGGILMSTQSVITWLSVVVQSAAAGLWFYATVAKVSAADVEAEYQKTHGPGSGPAQIVDEEDGSDIVATLQLQTKWNRWAAFTTGSGVLLMAIATAISKET